MGLVECFKYNRSPMTYPCLIMLVSGCCCCWAWVPHPIWRVAGLLTVSSRWMGRWCTSVCWWDSEWVIHILLPLCSLLHVHVRSGVLCVLIYLWWLHEATLFGSCGRKVCKMALFCRWNLLSNKSDSEIQIQKLWVPWILGHVQTPLVSICH